MSRNSKQARLHHEARARKGRAGPASTPRQHGKRNRVAKGSPWWQDGGHGQRKRHERPEVLQALPEFYEARAEGVTIYMGMSHLDAHEACAMSSCSNTVLYRTEVGVKKLLALKGYER